MGTTLTALQDTDRTGVPICFTLLIGGYEYVITDHATTSEIETAYASTAWDDGGVSVLGGLTIHGRIQQSIAPWSPRIEVSTLKFAIMDFDGDDTFGIDVFNVTGGNESFLVSNLIANETTTQLLSGADFDSSGSVYIGQERIKYTGKAGNNLTGCTRGYLEAIGADTETNQFGHGRTMPTYQFESPGKIVVSDEPRKWVGRTVALYAHRRVGSVVDTYAQAQRVFSGRIKEIQDSSRGETVIVAEDMRAKIRDCVLLRNQFRGTISEGVYISATDTLDCTVTYGTNATEVDAAQKTFAAGAYTVDELISEIQEWLNDDANVGVGTAITDEWKLQQDEEQHVKLAWDGQGTAPYWFELKTNGPIFYALGWREWETRFVDAISVRSIYGTDAYFRGTLPAVRARGMWEWNGTLTLTESEGAWFDNTDWLPDNLRDGIPSGEDWGVLEIGSGNFVLAQHSSDTSFTNVRHDIMLHALFGGIPTPEATEIRDDQDGDLEVRQVALLSGAFADLLPRLLASTGDAAYNHATYDVFAEHLGAGIPWDVLGADFLTSLSNELSDSTAANQLLIYLNKPERLTEVLGADMVLRNLHFVWKNGCLILASTSTAHESFSDHTLTEDNKGVPSGQKDPDRAPALTSAEYIRNTIRLNYNRDVTGQYQDHALIKHEKSIQEYGTRAITIKARNTFGRYAATGDSVEALMADVIAYVLSIWSRPLSRLRRTVNYTLWQDVAPGDRVLVTDNFARDNDGARGIAGRAGIILKHSYDWGHAGADGHGEVEILFDDEKYGPWSPTAQVASHALGFGRSVLTCETREHSDTNDGALRDTAYFTVGDEVVVIEIDPDDPAAVESDTETIYAISGNDITVDKDMSALDWANKTFRVVSASYSNAATAQQTETYMADSGDGQVEGGSPYLLGAYKDPVALSSAAATEFSERYSDDMFADGAPLSTGLGRMVCRNINNLLYYRTAPQAPCHAYDGTNHYFDGYASDTAWKCIIVKPYSVGAFKHVFGGRTRTFSITPGFARSAGADPEVECRFTASLFPPTGTTVAGVTFVEPYIQITFSSDSNAYAHISPAQNLGPISRPWSGHGWMTVEIRQTAASANVARFFGICHQHLDPFASII